MGRRLIKENEIIQLSKTVVESFYNRDVENSIDYLAKNFMWIGAFDFQVAYNKQQFLQIIESELNSTKFYVLDEDFKLITKTSSCYVVCAKFKLLTQHDENTIIRTHTRLTIVWQYLDNTLKLVHVHGSNAQDIPIAITDNVTGITPDKDFMAYLASLNSDSDKNKIGFKGIHGKYHYYDPREILYLEAQTQHTILHTRKEEIKLYGILRENFQKLPHNFYRIHKTYAVNADLVTSMQRYKVTLCDDINIAISKEKYIPFREFCQSRRDKNTK